MKMRVVHPTSALQVRVRLFGRYAEVMGMKLITVTVSEPATVADVIAQLRTQWPQAQHLPSTPLVAIDLEHVHGGRSVANGEELSILPPLAGG